MAVTQTKKLDNAVGSMRMTAGTFTGSGTSGSLYTGLQKTAFVYLQPTSAVSPAEQCTVNTTLPAVDPITIGFTTGGVAGYWFAIGW
jgi:hypothetical protein